MTRASLVTGFIVVACVVISPGQFTYGALQFSRNDLWIGVGTRSRARVYDVESSELLWEADDHKEYVYTVDFGADDKTLLSGGTDGVCYLWALEAERGDDSNDPESLFEQLVVRGFSSTPIPNTDNSGIRSSHT